MVSLRNIEKFIDDNPQSGLDKKTVMERAKEKALNGVISGGAVQEIFDDPLITAFFFREIELDPEHTKMGLEDIQKAHQESPSEKIDPV